MKGIVVFDIDDTLFKTQSTIFKVHDDTGDIETLTSDEYAVDKDIKGDNVHYDFSEFDNPVSIEKSLKNGKPLIRNLKIMDKYANMGYEIAFLTARSQEDVIYNCLRDIVKVRNTDGDLQPILNRLSKEMSTAVNDIKYDRVFNELTASERKAKVLKYMCMMYDKVIFVDDDLANIKAARSLGYPNLKTIVAQKEMMNVDAWYSLLKNMLKDETY